MFYSLKIIILIVITYIGSDAKYTTSILVTDFISRIDFTNFCQIFYSKDVPPVLVNSFYEKLSRYIYY